MTTVSSTDLQRDLTELLDRVEAGESIIVMRDDRAVAELRPAKTADSLRKIGLKNGHSVDPVGLDEPLPESVLREFHASNGKMHLPTPEQLTELERRIADSDANPDDGVPWEEIRAAALARLKRCASHSCFAGTPAKNTTVPSTGTMLSGRDWANDSQIGLTKQCCKSPTARGAFDWLERVLARRE